MRELVRCYAPSTHDTRDQIWNRWLAWHHCRGLHLRECAAGGGGGCFLCAEIRGGGTWSVRWVRHALRVASGGADRGRSNCCCRNSGKASQRLHAHSRDFLRGETCGCGGGGGGERPSAFMGLGTEKN